LRTIFACPQDDLPAAEARALIGPHRILGVSVKTAQQALAAAAAGADYLGAGAGGAFREKKLKAFHLCGKTGELLERSLESAPPASAHMQVGTSDET